MIISGVFLIWLALLTAGIYYIYSHYNRLTKDAKEANLMKALNAILKQSQIVEKNQQEIFSELKRLDNNAKDYVQKVSFVRYNPFHETGGNQSFSLTLLNREDTGFIISGLHARDRTRLYIKPVKNGKSNGQLSKDEQKSLKQALG